MAEKEATIKENYSKNLKARDYVAKMRLNYKMAPDMLPFSLKFIKDVLDSGKFKGTNLLEIGSGALVHNIASASALFPNIIMSDYVENNCEELKLWLKGESPITQFLDIPAKLEGFKDNLEIGKQIIEKRIKNAVKQVVRGDVLDDNILLEDPKPEVSPPYDFIISCLCLECSVPDLEGFSLALKRIHKLLRPRGGLILVGFLGGKSWNISGTDYHYIYISEIDVKRTLPESGFRIIDMKTRDKIAINYDHKGYYCLAAEKL